MSSIIHPWNLVIMFMVISVAAMVHSADEKDVGSVTGDHPEPRGGEINELQHSARDSFEEIRGLRRHKRSSQRTFAVTVLVSDISGSGTSSGFGVQVVYRSGRTWGPYVYFYRWNGFWAGYEYSFEKEATYYGTDDEVGKIYIEVFKAGAFMPEYIIIDGPEACDRYQCHWMNECGIPVGDHHTSYKYCYLEGTMRVEVPCSVQLESPGC